MNWTEAINYGWLVKIAESVRPNQAYGPAQLGEIKESGYSFLQTITGSDLATDIDAHAGDVVTFGFLAVSEAGELVAAIRGTDTILEWIHDAEFLMVPCPVAGTSGLADDGFTAVYKSLGCGWVKSSVKDSIAAWAHGDSLHVERVTVCGHSLGAALATLLALDVSVNTPFKNPKCFTFASPRVGDHVFARRYNQEAPSTVRVANRHDLVTMLPTVFPLPYEHVGIHAELKPSKEQVGTIPCMHHLSSYLWMMVKAGSLDRKDFPLNPECVAKAAK